VLSDYKGSKEDKEEDSEKEDDSEDSNQDECTCGVAKPSQNSSPAETKVNKKTQNKIVNG